MTEEIPISRKQLALCGLVLAWALDDDKYFIRHLFGFSDEEYSDLMEGARIISELPNRHTCDPESNVVV